MSNILIHNISVFCYDKKIPILPKILGRISRIIYSCEIPYTAKIHKSVIFAHKGLGVVIGHDVEIGENTKILQNVTIGGRGGIRATPKIGKNVLIGAGAVVLGDITIEDNVKVGANAIVVENIPMGATVISKKSELILKGEDLL